MSARPSCGTVRGRTSLLISQHQTVNPGPVDGSTAPGGDGPY